MLGCTGTPSTGPGQCQDMLQAVLLGGTAQPPSTFPMGTPVPVNEDITQFCIPIAFSSEVSHCLFG